MVTSEQEAMLQGIQALIQTVIERRDEGKELMPMDRILLIATQNTPDRIPTGTFFTLSADGRSLAGIWCISSGCWGGVGGTHILNVLATYADGTTAAAAVTLNVSDTLPPPVSCDVNGDSAVNVVDVQLGVNEALGSAACVSDLNGDGACNIVDVQRIVNAAMGGACVVGP